MATDYVHIPVLVKEIIQGLGIQPEGSYIDCTFGRGGHSQAILKRLGEHGRLFVFDKDPHAINSARILASKDTRIHVFHSSYSNLFTRLEKYGLIGSINGVLFDLGVSSTQIDNPERGFSFNLEGNLDMRMDPTSGMTASNWINNATFDEITHVLKNFGEEKYARRISKAIVRTRTNQPISTTTQLSEIVCSAIPTWEKKKHPATRTFQAIRIFLNNELDELAEGLSQAFDLLNFNGRLVVASFHSLEDRLVKRFMREYSTNDPYPKDIPVTTSMIKPRLKIIGKVLKPTASEISSNPRARSARLRIAEKIEI